MADITWIDRHEGAVRPSEAEIVELEETYGVRLPEDFRAALRAHGGMSPDKQLLVIDGKDELFSTLLFVADIEEDRPESFAFQQDRIDDWANEHPIRAQLMPIATGGGQDIYCYDVSSGEPVGVVLIDLNVSPDADGALTAVASSFSEILDRLEE